MRRPVKPSPAMVVATIALVVAGTGTGLAAALITSAQIADNTIVSADVRNGSLKSVDIKDGTVSPSDLSSTARALGVEEVVFGGGNSFPATLTNQFSLSNSTTMTVTTTRKGRLLVDARFNGDFTCSSTTFAWAFIMLDGAAVRSSLNRVALDAFITAGGAAQDFSLQGITEAAVAPGNHTVALGAMCSTGAMSGSGTGPAPQRVSVVVLR